LQIYYSLTELHIADVRRKVAEERISWHDHVGDEAKLRVGNVGGGPITKKRDLNVELFLIVTLCEELIVKLGCPLLCYLKWSDARSNVGCVEEV
jgi:hypothetical protein